MKSNKFKFSWIALALVIFSADISFALGAEANSDTVRKIDVNSERVFDHSEFDALLKAHVDENGLVDYEGFKKDRVRLDGYLAKLAKVDPDKLRSDDEKNAFFINAYNAFTIRAVLDDVYKKTTSVKKVKGFWKRKVNVIGGKKYSLDKIEKQSRKLKDPRMHFAVNCASLGCPKLQRFAYDGSKLQQQFAFITKDFLSDMERGLLVNREKDKVGISKIFSWYAGDFSGNTSAFGFYTGFIKSKFSKSAGIKFIAKEVPMDIADYLKSGKPDIEYLDYDWGLNSQPKPQKSARQVD